VIHFAQTCEAIARTAGKLEKIDVLAAYLRSLDDADLESAARYFTGSPFAQKDQRKLAIGGSAIVRAAQNVWGVTDAELSASYRERGDLGSALAPFVRAPADLGLFREPLSPASLQMLFDEAAAASGPAAGRRRLHVCERILRRCREPIEAKYVIKIMTGDLRIGLREGLVTDAIARAFDARAADVRRAAMAAADVGSVAVAARRRQLSGVEIAYGRPIAFMLASPLEYGSAYRELKDARWLVEDKFDGIRAQAHKQGDEVHLYSRTLSDVSNTYPEVVEALRGVPGTFMLDGELIAQRNGNVLPFRYLQARLQRKTVTRALLDEIPVVYAVFDVLAQDDEYLLDEPLLQRRKRLERLLAPRAGIAVAASRPLAPGAGPDALHGLFEDARARGHEGLVIKRADSPYHPGRRGKWWLKLKRELSTLDVVVIAVEWGHGKRAQVLSDYTFAVRGDRGELLAIGKAYSGLTDVEIAELTPWFLEHRLPPSRGRPNARESEIPVEPNIVLEVAFDVIQKSDLHESGFALRFPRIVRIRDDKPMSEIDTLDRVREIYEAMLSREGVT
jgi:DNA ligase-1